MESQGYALVQGGRHNETRFAYFDTTGVIGAFTEIVRLQPEERAFMHSPERQKVTARDLACSPRGTGEPF